MNRRKALQIIGGTVLTAGGSFAALQGLDRQDILDLGWDERSYANTLMSDAGHGYNEVFHIDAPAGLLDDADESDVATETYLTEVEDVLTAYGEVFLGVGMTIGNGREYAVHTHHPEQAPDADPVTRLELGDADAYCAFQSLLDDDTVTRYTDPLAEQVTDGFVYRCE